MSLRVKQKQETRKHIQKVAKELITEHGYEKTTMRMLSKAAEVGLGTISLHFSDKKSLLLASFYEEIGEVAMNGISSIPQDRAVRDQIEHCLRTLYGYYAKNTRYTGAVAREALFAKGEWGDIFDNQIKDYVAIFTSILDHAKEQGKLERAVDSRGLTMVVWSVYLHGLINGLKKPVFDPEVQMEMISPMLDALLHGAVPKEE